jgi:hypothetical protein
VEPLLVAERPELVEQARSLGVEVAIPANGTLWDDARGARLLGAEPALACFSVEGDCAESHEVLRGRAPLNPR